MTQLNDLWGPVEAGSGSGEVYTLGSLTLRVRREPFEVWVTGAHETSFTPSAKDWIRWAVAPTDKLELRPSLPDRPIVVSPEQPFFLPPGGEARVFVRVPLFVRLVRANEDGSVTMFEAFPSLVLSDTWWGTFTEGEVAYWVGTRARRAVSPEIFEAHLAVCPFLLVNRSELPLPVERFAVQVSHLTLFGHGNAVWTDEVQVRYEGLQEGSELRYTGRVPREAGEVQEIAPPSEPAPRGLHARTFGRLRALSGLA